MRPPHTHDPSQSTRFLILQAGEYTGAAKISKVRGTGSNDMRSPHRLGVQKELLDLAVVSTGQGSMGDEENSC